MLPALGQHVRVHVHDVTADGLGRRDGQGQVFVFLEEGQFGTFVDDPVVDGVRDGEVDQLAQENSVADLFVDIGSVVVQRHQVGQFGHPAQVGVDPVGEGALLLFEDHVVTVAVLALVNFGVVADDFRGLPIFSSILKFLGATYLRFIIIKSCNFLK